MKVLLENFPFYALFIENNLSKTYQNTFKAHFEKEVEGCFIGKFGTGIYDLNQKGCTAYFIDHRAEIFFDGWILNAARTSL